MGRIVHIGLGNFARAHLLDYTRDAGGWDVVGVSLRSGEVRDGLAAQGFGYDLCVQGLGVKRIGVLCDVLVAPENPRAVLDAVAQADIVSVTVTEKGYYLDARDDLDLSAPAIVRDRANPLPKTVIGFLARALVGRKTPLTVMSCDNRVANGGALEGAVRRFAEVERLEIDWSIVTFPNGMVDRITPATTDRLRAISGDPMAVPTEAFREWVIEDRFAGPRPDWPDVQFVQDVAPHELRKLRMLNGAHSLLAYAGLARGHTYVHQAVADPELRVLAQDLMAQAGATLPTQVQPRVPGYAAALITRFENPELRHRLDQIAMDGSQKVPYRFVGTLTDGDAPAVVEGLRAWIAYCVAETRAGRVLNDPKAAEIASIVQSATAEQGLLALVGGQDFIPLIQG